MAEIATRPMTPDERERLAAFADEPRTRVDVWVVGFLAPLALLYIPFLLAQSAFPAARSLDVPFLLACLALGALLASFLRRRRARGSEGTGPLVEADLRQGEVEVERLAITRAARVRRDAGREPALLVEAPGEGVVFLEGPYLRAALEARQVPRESLVLARAPLSRHVLALTGEGRALDLDDIAESAIPAGDEGPFHDGEVIGESWPEPRA